MAGVRDSRRIQTMRVAGEGKAGEVNGNGRQLGERRILCGKRCFQKEMGDARTEK